MGVSSKAIRERPCPQGKESIGYGGAIAAVFPRKCLGRYPSRPAPNSPATRTHTNGARSGARRKEEKRRSKVGGGGKGWGSFSAGKTKQKHQRGTDIPGLVDRYPRKLLQGQDHNNTMDTNPDPHLSVLSLRLTARELLLAARREPIARHLRLLPVMSTSFSSALFRVPMGPCPGSHRPP